jgi:quinol monooxygenase YgiN
MIVLTIRMNVLPEKRKELLQTVRALTSLTRKEDGCIRYHFYQDIEDENAFGLVAEWQTKRDLDNHLRSDRFGVLLGAMDLLCEPPEMKFNAVAYSLHREGACNLG